MMPIAKNKISIRIFAACLITSEIRMHLNYSIEWKHSAFDVLSASLCFQEIRLHGKDYFGFYIEYKTYKISELDEIQNKIRDQLKAYCPKLDTETIDICIIPQVFVA
jgi:hypothetical protein